MRDAYDWDPGAVIEDADVLGVEAALWSETTETRDDVDYLVFPRLPAVAEVAWSGERDWKDFRSRLGGARPAALRPRCELSPIDADRLGLDFS